VFLKCRHKKSRFIFCRLQNGDIACVTLHCMLHYIYCKNAVHRPEPVQKVYCYQFKPSAGPVQSRTNTRTTSNSTFGYCIPSNDTHFWLQRFLFLHSYAQKLLPITERSTVFTKMLVCFHAIQHRWKNQSRMDLMHVQCFTSTHS